MKNVLIIGFIWPEPKSTAAGSRMLQLIKSLSDQNYKITFASTATKSSASFPLQSIQVNEVQIKLNDSGIDTILKDISPGIVIFDRYLTEEQFGWRIDHILPKAIKILNTEDLHSLRKSRQFALKKEIAFSIDLLKNQEICKREIASIYRCDLTLLVSSYEVYLLKNYFKIDEDLLLHLPLFYESMHQSNDKQWPGFDERKDFVTIGNFLHEPNWDSVLFLKKKIWPEIRKNLPQANLYIYGAYPSQKALQLHQPKEGFYIEGYTEDAESIMQNAKVCLAPLRFGAGIKGKLLEAMRNGTPSITSTIGSEGMRDDQDELDWNGFIADDPSDFAKAAVRLYQDGRIWKQAQQNGISIINTLFNEEDHKMTLPNTISLLQKNIENHRLCNFTGEILKHHTLRSTEFMSRWIEEKNKK